MSEAWRVPRPDKSTLASDIASLVGIDAPAVSRGSSVDSGFLDDTYRALVGTTSGGVDTYRKTERLLLRLGRTYDPFWDTSESRGSTGGGTVTVRAYSQMRSAISGIERCFVVPAPRGGEAEVSLPLSEGTPGARSLLEAGPGTTIIYVRGANTENPVLVGAGQVRHISPGWTGPWDVELINYAPLSEARYPADLHMDGFVPTRITEISPALRDRIIRPVRSTAVPASGTTAKQIDDEAETPSADLAGDVVAEKVIERFPISDSLPAISVPASAPGQVDIPEARRPTYVESEERVVAKDGLPKRSRNSRRDKLAELRAIEIATKSLARSGWQFTRDRQKDGVGYDLEFERDSRVVHVEVKGIVGEALAFNLTPKELWRAETDSNWFVLAVTRVLSPTDFQVNVIARERIAESAIVIAGYRVSFE